MGRDDGCSGREGDHRVEHPTIDEAVERILNRAFALLQNQRALAKVVNDQARENDQRPGVPNRSATEMAHVGVEGFAPGDTENDRAQNEKARAAVHAKELKRIGWIRGFENAWISKDPRKSCGRDDNKPDESGRAEDRADARSSATLNHEQADQNRDRKRHDIGIECRCGDLQTFDRGENRNGRCNEAIAVKQRRADEAHDHDHGRAIAAAMIAGFGIFFRGGAGVGIFHAHRFAEEQGQEGHDSTFASVIRAKNEDQIFDADD